MSEFLRQHPVFARAAAPVAVLALMTGCSEGSSQDASPATWELTIPDVPDVTTTEVPNECEVNNPEISSFHTSDVINADFEEVGNRIYANSELTEEQSVRFTEDLKAGYGINLTFPDAVAEDSLYDFGSVNDSPESAKQAKDIAILSVIDAVRNFSPELIKALNLTEVAYVDGITRKPGYEGAGLELAGGLYNEQTNTIYIDVNRFSDTNIYAASTKTMVHELSHALDTQLICGPDSGALDREFMEHNSVFYEGYSGYEDDPEGLDDKHYKPSSSRVFATRYGSAGVKEDRATIIEWTFAERGLILEGDPDSESPLAKKQAILVNRLEQLAPGITAYLHQHTALLRVGVATLDYSNELTDNMESSIFPGEFLSVEDTLARARDEDESVEILTNAIVEIDHPYLGYPSITVNPVVLRDPSGMIRAIAWSNGHSMNTTYFDQTRMRIRFSGDQLVSRSGKMELKFEGNPDSPHFFSPSHLAVNGIAATVDYADSDSAQQALQQSFPNVFDPWAPQNTATTIDPNGLNIPTTTSTTR